MRTAGLEVRAAEGESPRLAGHFSVFNEWTEIASFFEGNFMERIAPGAFKRTFKNDRASIRLLFQHGRDAALGMKPLGTVDELREDEVGAYYEASLYRGVPELVMDGLRDGQYGASFKFEVLREEFVERPKPSDHNPRGIPERTVREAKVYEFGPVTFPAYAGATAGLRSITDEFLTPAERERLATPITTRVTAAPAPARRGRFQNDEEWMRWIRS